MCKVIPIPSLVWLRRSVRRWRSGAASSVRSDKQIADGAAVPDGHVAVRAADASGRFVVRLAHLTHPALLELLWQAEEEYGFPSASGPIALPCDEDHLRDVLRRVSSSEEKRRLCGIAKRRAGESRPLLHGLTVEKLVL